MLTVLLPPPPQKFFQNFLRPCTTIFCNKVHPVGCKTTSYHVVYLIGIVKRKKKMLTLMLFLFQNSISIKATFMKKKIIDVI